MQSAVQSFPATGARDTAAHREDACESYLLLWMKVVESQGHSTTSSSSSGNGEVLAGTIASEGPCLPKLVGQSAYRPFSLNTFWRLYEHV